MTGTLPVGPNLRPLIVADVTGSRRSTKLALPDHTEVRPPGLVSSVTLPIRPTVTDVVGPEVGFQSTVPSSPADTTGLRFDETRVL